MSQPTYLYIMSRLDEAHKIGTSIDPRRRRNTLGRGVKLLWQSEVGDTHTAEIAELIAHRILAKKRLDGEWFNVCFDLAHIAAQRAIRLTVDKRDFSILHPYKGIVRYRRDLKNERIRVGVLYSAFLRKKFTPELQEKARQMLREGKGRREVADTLGFHASLISKYWPVLFPASQETKEPENGE